MTTRRFARAVVPRRPEHRHTFACFGGQCTVIVADAARPADAAAAAAMARRALLTWHDRFSRFTESSELSRLNRDPAATVAVTPLMRRVIETGLTAARDTNGLVDITLADEIERAGYASHFDGEGADLRAALDAAPPRAPAARHPNERWRQISVDPRAWTVRRPPGLRIDVGGIAKGVFADELAPLLEGFDAYVLDCAGDLRVGGRAGVLRPVHVAAPFGISPLLTFALSGGAVATSGISHRSWIDGDGRPAHHLLDPRTGAPVFTGIVQATALAPTAAQAEVLAKAAVLSGPASAAEWLPHGGVIVSEDGSYDRVEPAVPAATGATGATRSASHATRSASTASRSGSLRISWKRPA
ncbi:MAG TPA: FAD:protein FMN transferase [Solirubrobacteraceae bacterium]|jgi:thiamine biosynthesis lipoprotein|nr:FAD:protein FMN transferase [Solirubrobacteraceae bacterium]